MVYKHACQNMFKDPSLRTRNVTRATTRKLYPQYPAESTARNETVSRTVFIQSNQRVVTDWPHTNTYAIELSPPLQNVVQLQIHGGVFVASETGVFPHACWLDIFFPLDSGHHRVESICLPTGAYQYDMRHVVSALNQAWNTRDPPAQRKIRFQWDELVQVVRVHSEPRHPCVLQFASGPHALRSMWRQLGFARADTQPQVTHTSIHRPDLNGTQLVQIVCRELYNTPNYVMGTLLVDDKHQVQFRQMEREYMWPIARVVRMTLELRVPATNSTPSRLYHTDGLDHTLVVEARIRVPKNNLLEEVELDSYI